MILTLPYYIGGSSPVGSKGLPHVITTTGINGLALGDTNLLTVPASSTFILHSAVVRLTALTGVPGAVGEIKIKNDTDAVDLIASFALTGLDTASEAFVVSLTGAFPIVAAAKVVAAEVTVAYTVATTVTLAVDLIGYLV
jgi:hypothetical protein